MNDKRLPVTFILPNGCRLDVPAEEFDGSDERITLQIEGSCKVIINGVDVSDRISLPAGQTGPCVFSRDSEIDDFKIE